MKSRGETRLECLRMANTLGVAKVIQPKDVIPQAMEFFKWVDDDPNEDAGVPRLAERFRTRGAS